MKKKKIKWNITIPVVLLVALALLLSATFALFTENVDGTRTFKLSNFTSTLEVYFENPSTQQKTYLRDLTSSTIGDSVSFPVSINEFRSVNGSNVRNTNYIGDLHINVIYSGLGVGLMRVKVTEEWSKTESGIRTVYPYSLKVDYKVDDIYSGNTGGNQHKWFDNRGVDSCFYYASPVSSANPATYYLISGVDTNNMDFGAITAEDLTIVVKADVVQVNRYPQYWGITSLPWGKPANPASSMTENA